ncbi:MAG TPA: methionyl-tRNA formyltransferase [Polyangiaceae bacterium]|nr:methionyl-tRNA formyltransferase [Polyangiaceae bacterium]
MPLRAIFFGTPEIAVPSLRTLATVADVVAVVCQPDRPAGRGLKLHAPAAKLAAGELGIPVVQPTKIRTPDFLAWLREQRADVAVVLAYGRILPGPVLSAPARGCLNLHASILPRYRGAAPISWAIVRGETETGMSLMQMDEGLDTGPVFTMRKLSIGEDETAGELAVRLGALAAEIVGEDVPRVVGGELSAVPQDHAAATSAPPLEKEQGRIDWQRSATEVHNHVRGMTPWPSAFTTTDAKLLKVLATRRSTLKSPSALPGTILAADSSGVLVSCGEGVLEIVRAQVEGRRPLDARELVAGRTLTRGARLG